MNFKRILSKYDGCKNPVYVHALDGSAMRFDVAIRCMDPEILSALADIEADEQSLFDMYAGMHKYRKRQEWELYRTIPESIRK